MDFLNSQGETVYLKASPEVLCAHLRMGKGVRPLLLNKTPEEVEAFVREQLKAREPFYMKAKHVYDINVLDSFNKIGVAARQIVEMVGQ